MADHRADWPLPNKDYENTRATFDSEISSENAANLKAVWSFPIPGISGFGAAASNPIIRLLPTMALGGAIVINDLVFTAEFDGTIHAFKIDSGDEVFVYKAPAGINGWPAVADDAIVWPAGSGDEPSLIAIRLDAGPKANQNATETDEAGTEAIATEETSLTQPNSLVAAESISNETGGAKWAADGVVSEGKYSKSLSLSGGRYAVHWKNDAEDLYMVLVGLTDGFVAIGFEPSQAMKDVDMIMGWVSDGNAIVLDLYSSGIYGPHPPDVDLGGKGDILEFGGSESENGTVIEFKRKMDTGDQFDRAFQPGQSVNIIWSMSSSDALAVRHNARGASTINLV